MICVSREVNVKACMSVAIDVQWIQKVAIDEEAEGKTEGQRKRQSRILVEWYEKKKKWLIQLPLVT